MLVSIYALYLLVNAIIFFINIHKNYIFWNIPKGKFSFSNSSA